MYQHQYQYDDDVDSICNELAYPAVNAQFNSDQTIDGALYDQTVDGGFYSDAGYQSPGLNMDKSRAQEELFTPITMPDTTPCKPLLSPRNLRTQQASTNLFEKKVKNIDLMSNKYNSTPYSSATKKQQQSRPSKIKPYIENSDVFYVPQHNSLLLQRPSPIADMLLKDENISPVTISSGYSSDKDEALRQLDLEYASDESHSPLHATRSQLSPATPRHCGLNKDTFVIRSDELYDTYGHCGSNKIGQQVPQKAFNKSKDSHYSRRHSTASNPTLEMSLSCVERTLSNLKINSSDCPIPLQTHQVDLRKPETVTKRPASTTSNVSVNDLEKLPEILPAGVRTSYTISSGILMAPETSVHCRRCMSFATSPIIKSPSTDLSHFRVSKDSAFRPVNMPSLPRSNSTPPRAHLQMAPLETFRTTGDNVHENVDIDGFGFNSSNCAQLLMTPNGSRVVSLSDSGRGSASSIDLALSELPSLDYHVGVVPHSSNSVYQDMSREQVYETVPERSSELYVNNTRQQTPPKLPKRNSRSRSMHRTPRAARKPSSLVKYEDIVKPQDIVDASAMHMYTVADVLNSVGRLSSDIPQSSNDMCIHDDYAHFVFDSTPQKSLYRAASQSSVRDIHLQLKMASMPNDYLNSSSFSSPRVPRDMNMPLQARQNTACEAQTKRLPKIELAQNMSCNSPCLRNKSKGQPRSHTQYLNTTPQIPALKSSVSRTLSNTGHRSRSKSLVRSDAHLDSSITWSPRGNMTEVYC